MISKPDQRSNPLGMTTELVPFSERKHRFSERWFGFQRKTLEEYWELGCELDSIMSQMQHGERGPWLAEIGLDKTMANNMRRVSREHEKSKLSTFRGFVAAVKALPPKRSKDEPETESEAFDPPAATGDVLTEAQAEAAMDEVAVEAQAATAEAEREAKDERLAVRLADTDGDAVDVLSDKLDRADGRHREDVTAVNDARQRENAKDRKLRDICDALLTAKPSTALDVIDEVLATFFAVARKARGPSRARA